MQRHIRWVMTCSLLGCAVMSRAQAPSAQNPAAAEKVAPFEVASVKLDETCTNGTNRGMQNLPSPGRLSLKCMPLQQLVLLAYVTFANGAEPDFRRPEISGGPNWVRTDAFTLNAKAEDAAPVPKMMGPMMRALLEERFKLAIHHQPKEGSVFYLTVAKGGLKVKPAAEGSCMPLDFNKLSEYARTNDKPPTFCGGQSMSFTGRTGKLKTTGATFEQLAQTMLSNLLGEPVIDKTGITDRFDLELDFAPDSTTPNLAGRGGGRGDASDPNAALVPETSDLPNLVGALAHIGLKVEPGKGPVDTIVIDHAEKPIDQ